MVNASIEGAIALLVYSKSLSSRRRLDHPHLRKHIISVGAVSMIAHARSAIAPETYLASGGMQHANVLRRNDVLQSCGFQQPYLDEVGLECQKIWMGQSEALRASFPVDEPVLSGSPAVPVDKEREIRVVEKEFAIESFDGYRYIVFPFDKIQRRIGVI